MSTWEARVNVTDELEDGLARAPHAIIRNHNNNNNKFQAFDDKFNCQQIDRIGDELQITVNS